jgi:hypothetical protein
VYAGDYGDSRSCTGVLVRNVLPWPTEAGQDIGTVTEYPLNGTGPVRFIGYSGVTLSFLTAGGSRGLFNAETGAIRYLAVGSVITDQYICQTS